MEPSISQSSFIFSKSDKDLWDGVASMMSAEELYSYLRASIGDGNLQRCDHTEGDYHSMLRGM